MATEAKAVAEAKASAAEDSGSEDEEESGEKHACFLHKAKARH